MSPASNWLATNPQPACVSLSRSAAGNPSFGLFPNQAAGATKLPAMRFRGGLGIGSGARDRSTPGLPGGSWRRGTRTDPIPWREKRFRQRRSGRPITGVIYHSPHPLEPPIGAARMPPVSARRSKPRSVLESQFQLAIDHGSPFSLSEGRMREPGLGEARKAGTGKIIRRGLGPRLGIRP